MSEWSGSLDLFARDLAGRWSTYLGGIVTLSLLCMAILQTVKDLSPVRRAFQRRFLRRWFAAKCPSAAEVSVVERDLVQLATDGDRNAFFDLPIEQLCGQITAAAQIVVENPRAHEALVRCLAAHAPKQALDTLLRSELPLRRQLERLKQRGEAGTEEMQELAEAKTRVMHQIQRSLDGLQISATYRWKFGFQVASFVLSFTLAYIASTDGNIGHRLFVGAAAGFLAPVARDLQARLQVVK